MNFQENLAEDDCAPCLEIKCKNILINIVLKIYRSSFLHFNSI